MKQKLRNNRGETLVEVMASILISALSVALLFSCVAASFDMDKDAKELDKNHYKYLSAAETKDGTSSEGGAAKSGELTIQNTAGAGLSGQVDILLYGGGGMWSYELKGSG